MNFTAGPAPVFAIFEVAQLYYAHRYIGPAQIRRKLYPLDTSVAPPPYWFSIAWIVVLGADYGYQVRLFLVPFGLIRLMAFVMIVVSLIGFMVRRHCGLKWGLVVMTFEGALRVGLLLESFSFMVYPPRWLHHLGGNL
jgi:hypothetical protein